MIVGTGACGCEYLKNLVLMGCSSIKDSNILLIDDGKVKNLNSESHFLWMK